MHPLKIYIKENHINMGDFCKTLGVSRQTLHNIINYKFYPRRTLAKKIENVTKNKITVIDLLYPKNIDFEVKNAN